MEVMSSSLINTCMFLSKAKDDAYHVYWVEVLPAQREFQLKLAVLLKALYGRL